MSARSLAIVHERLAAPIIFEIELAVVPAGWCTVTKNQVWFGFSPWPGICVSQQWRRTCGEAAGRAWVS